MAVSTGEGDGGGARPPRRAAGREALLAARLRDNLRRRKAQARGRREAVGAEPGEAETRPEDAEPPPDG